MIYDLQTLKKYNDYENINQKINLESKYNTYKKESL